MTLFDVSANLSPVLTNGSFDVVFSQLERVTHAIMSFDQSWNVDSSGQIDASLVYYPDHASANAVRVTMKYKSTQQGTGNRIDATTAMLAGKKVVILAFSNI